MVPACRNKRIPLEGSLNGVDDRKGVLSDGGDVAPDAAENICSLSTAKRARDFLLNFHHPDIAFRLIIIERNAKVIHKA